MTRITMFLALATALLFAGCGTVREAGEAPQPATGKLVALQDTPGMTLRRVDGKRAESSAVQLSAPGRHTLEYDYFGNVDFNKRRLSARLPPMNVYVEPGYQYRPQCDTARWPTVRGWIEESQDGSNWRRLPDLGTPAR